MPSITNSSKKPNKLHQFKLFQFGLIVFAASLLANFCFASNEKHQGQLTPAEESAIIERLAKLKNEDAYAKLQSIKMDATLDLARIQYILKRTSYLETQIQANNFQAKYSFNYQWEMLTGCVAGATASTLAYLKNRKLPAAGKNPFSLQNLISAIGIFSCGSGLTLSRMNHEAFFNSNYLYFANLKPLPLDSWRRFLECKINAVELKKIGVANTLPGTEAGFVDENEINQQCGIPVKPNTSAAE